MPKDRSFGDRGTGYTPRNEKKFGEDQDGVKDVVITQL